MSFLSDSNLSFTANLKLLLSMTSINNSSAAKFLALFCIPALVLASGQFDVASSVIV
tara:strand:- start:124 stop:294 length:171 start_codon:yes stop_codon:yes gene_type:complete